MGGAPLVPLGMVSGVIPPVAIPVAVPIAGMAQPISQPLVQSMMQPMMQPMGQAMVQPMVPSNLPLVMQGTGSPVGVPLMAANIPGPAGMISPPLVAAPPTGFPVSTASFDGSKPNTPDSSKTVIRAPSVTSRES